MEALRSRLSRVRSRQLKRHSRTLGQAGDLSVWQLMRERVVSDGRRCARHAPYAHPQAEQVTWPWGK